MSLKTKRVDFCDEVQVMPARRTRSRSRGRFKSRRARSQELQGAGRPESSDRKRDRSLVDMVRQSSRNSVRNLVKLFEMKTMTEGRKSQIVLLDERRLDITIQPKLYAGDLLDLVASHFKLKEKQYFGLAFLDETGHYNWLQPEKRVLDHDLPKKPGLLVLYFAIRFYIETIGLLRDIATVELFYLNARQAIFKGQIECDSDTIFELAAYVLQAQNGDCTSDEDTAAELKKLPLIPTYTLKEHPSIVFCEEKVNAHYQRLVGTSRGLAIVNYMTIVERLPTYGIHYYEVKDKKDIPWWLGISPKGIAVYDKNDKTTPRRIFTWKQLENLYYRDKKFSIEVHDPKRIVHTLSSFNLYEDAIRERVEEYDSLSDAITHPSTQVSVSRRTFGPGCVNVHAWFAATSQLTKCIWSMAVAQHQFYLDRKQSKGHLSSARSMSEIAADLSRSTTSLPGSLGSDLSRSTSSQSLPSLSASRFDLNIDSSETAKAQREMYQALKARKEALEDALRRKTEELKRLCFQEGEILGELPPETPLAPGEQPPTFRRRVGTTFSLSVKAMQDNSEDQLTKLELEFDLQSKITSAAQRLAQDKSVPKSVRKQRRQSYNKAIAKLKETEKKLVDMRRQSGLADIPEGSGLGSPTSLHPPPPSYEGRYPPQLPHSHSDDVLYTRTLPARGKKDKSRMRLSNLFRTPSESTSSVWAGSEMSLASSSGSLVSTRDQEELDLDGSFEGEKRSTWHSRIFDPRLHVYAVQGPQRSIFEEVQDDEEDEEETGFFPGRDDSRPLSAIQESHI